MSSDSSRFAGLPVHADEQLQSNDNLDRILQLVELSSIDLSGLTILRFPENQPSARSSNMASTSDAPIDEQTWGFIRSLQSRARLSSTRRSRINRVSAGGPLQPRRRTSARRNNLVQSSSEQNEDVVSASSHTALNLSLRQNRPQVPLSSVVFNIVDIQSSAQTQPLPIHPDMDMMLSRRQTRPRVPPSPVVINPSASHPSVPAELVPTEYEQESSGRRQRRVNMTTHQIRRAILKRPQSGTDNKFLTSKSCSICMTNYQEILLAQTHLMFTECGHVFCKNCADVMIRPRNSRCAQCRTSIGDPDTVRRLHLPMAPEYNQNDKD